MFIQKLTTMVRGSVRESADAIIDANAMRIFEQEIGDCEKGIRNAKASLSVVVAEKIKLQCQVEQSQQAIRLREEQALELIRKDVGAARETSVSGETGLLEQLAEVIAQEASVLKALQTSLSNLQRQEQRVSQQLKSTVHTVQDYRRELELVKATAHGQQACKILQGQQQKMDVMGEGLADSLQRIKSCQQHLSDQLAAQQQVHSSLNNDGLDAQLKAQGIGQEDRAKAVLARLKGKAK